MRDINLLSLDLELNQPSGSIIQVGACVGNLKTGTILEEYITHIFVNEEISDYIKKLTGIKQYDTNHGCDLSMAYSDLIDLHKTYQCFRNPIVWGGGDSLELRKQLNISDDESYLFGRRWLDVKTLFVSRCFLRDEKHQAGLAKALLRMGLRFQGRKHNALDDAINTFLIYRKLLEDFNNEAQGNPDQSTKKDL